MTDPRTAAIIGLMKTALTRIAELHEQDMFDAQQIADEALFICDEIDLDMLDNYAEYKLRAPKAQSVFATGLEGAFAKDKPIGKARSRFEALRLQRAHLTEKPWSQAEIEDRFPNRRTLQPRWMSAIYTPSAYYLDDDA